MSQVVGAILDEICGTYSYGSHMVMRWNCPMDAQKLWEATTFDLEPSLGNGYSRWKALEEMNPSMWFI
jgi:hypothetical protein